MGKVSRSVLVFALVFATVLLVTSGCGEGSPGPAAGKKSRVSSAADAAVASRSASGKVLFGGSRFSARPKSAGGRGEAANYLLGVRYGAHEGYERVVLDLGVGNEPAKNVPAWTLYTARGDGLLHVSLPSVSASAVSDGRFGKRGGALRDFHVVRRPDGGMFVDLVSREAFSYRVVQLGNPARIAIDFKSFGGSPKVPLPAEGGKTVLVEPRFGGKVGRTLIVGGYSRNPEGRNEISLTDSSGKVLVRRYVQSNDWSAAWGYFETTLNPPEFWGRATLKVGAASARDGRFSGVEIPVVSARPTLDTTELGSGR